MKILLPSNSLANLKNLKIQLRSKRSVKATNRTILPFINPETYSHLRATPIKAAPFSEETDERSALADSLYPILDQNIIANLFAQDFDNICSIYVMLKGIVVIHKTIEEEMKSIASNFMSPCGLSDPESILREKLKNKFNLFISMSDGLARLTNQNDLKTNLITELAENGYIDILTIRKYLEENKVQEHKDEIKDLLYIVGKKTIFLLTPEEESNLIPPAYAGDLKKILQEAKNNGIVCMNMPDDGIDGSKSSSKLSKYISSRFMRGACAIYADQPENECDRTEALVKALGPDFLLNCLIVDHHGDHCPVNELRARLAHETFGVLEQNQQTVLSSLFYPSISGGLPWFSSLQVTPPVTVCVTPVLELLGIMSTGTGLTSVQERISEELNTDSIKYLTEAAIATDSAISLLRINLDDPNSWSSIDEKLQNTILNIIEQIKQNPDVIYAQIYSEAAQILSENDEESKLNRAAMSIAKQMKVKVIEVFRNNDAELNPILLRLISLEQELRNSLGEKFIRVCENLISAKEDICMWLDDTSKENMKIHLQELTNKALEKLFTKFAHLYEYQVASSKTESANNTVKVIIIKPNTPLSRVLQQVIKSSKDPKAAKIILGNYGEFLTENLVNNSQSKGSAVLVLMPNLQETDSASSSYGPALTSIRCFGDINSGEIVKRLEKEGVDVSNIGHNNGVRGAGVAMVPVENGSEIEDINLQAYNILVSSFSESVLIKVMKLFQNFCTCITSLLTHPKIN